MPLELSSNSPEYHSKNIPELDRRHLLEACLDGKANSTAVTNKTESGQGYTNAFFKDGYIFYFCNDKIDLFSPLENEIGKSSTIELKKPAVDISKLPLTTDGAVAACLQKDLLSWPDIPDGRRYLLDGGVQANAIRVSYSDCMANFFWQNENNMSPLDPESWKIGKGIFNYKNTFLHDIKNPGTAFNDLSLGEDPEVKNMSDYVKDSERNAYNANRGIPNRACALYTTDISQMDGSNKCNQGAMILYVSMSTLAAARVADVTFDDWAKLNIRVAEKLFPQQPQIAQAVKDAWVEVGVMK